MPTSPHSLPDHHDYEHDLVLAKLSQAVYASKGEIIASMTGSFNPEEKRFTLPTNWSLLGEDRRNPHNYWDENADNGFVAAAFEGPGNQIVIAFRGSDDIEFDWKPGLSDATAGPNMALAADGDVLKELAGVPLRGETPKAQASAITGALLPDWDVQFKRALEYVKEIKENYPDHTIEVTGHSLGGALAQVASHAYGLDGRTFDPGGARNIVQSQEYRDWCRANIEPDQNAQLSGAAGLPVREVDFVNYLVNDSLVSQQSGPHVHQDRNVDISALTGRQGMADHAVYAMGWVGARASDVIDLVPPVLGVTAGPKAIANLPKGAELYLQAMAESDLTGRHDIDRIVRVFEKAAATGKLPQLGQETDAPEPAGPDRRLAAPLMTEPDHPSHRMYLQAQSALSKVETAPGLGLTQDEKAHFGAWVVAEALSAQGWNFTRVDHVVPGRIDLQTGRAETAFIVQGGLDDPAHRRIAVNVEQAVSQSIEQSSSVAQTLERTRQETRQTEQTRNETMGVDVSQGPVMRIGGRILAKGSEGGGESGGGGGDG